MQCPFGCQVSLIQCFLSIRILNKYVVPLQRCLVCGLVGYSNPHWLAETQAAINCLPVSAYDSARPTRNQLMAQHMALFLRKVGDSEKKTLSIADANSV